MLNSITYREAAKPPVTHFIQAPYFLPQDVGSRFGLRLRQMRKERSMTQLQMSIEFGIDRSYISDVERGRKSISLHMLEVIALGMQVSLSDLFRDL